MIIRYTLYWSSANKKAKIFIGDIERNPNKSFRYYMFNDNTNITDYIVLGEWNKDSHLWKNITHTEIGDKIIKTIRKEETKC